MKYILLIYGNEQDYAGMTQEQGKQLMSDYMQLSASLQKDGKYQAGSQLQPTANATSVRVRDGKRLVTAGPFAETREQLGGYYLIEAKDLDEALAIAERVPTAKFGTIEVRPLVAMPPSQS